MMNPTHWQTAYRTIREDRSNSFTLRDDLARAMDRDPLDALADAETLCEILRARSDEQIGGDGIAYFNGDREWAEAARLREVVVTSS